MIRNWMCTLAFLSVACGGESPDKSAATEAKTANTTAVEKKVVKFDKSTLQAEALEIALVPSPAEMQKALNNAGLQSQLSTMVEKRDIAMKAENKDQIAVEMAPMRDQFGKSVVTRSDLPGGTSLTLEHLTVKKPGTGIPASKLYELVGRRLRDDVVGDQLLTEEMLESTE